MRLSLLFFAVSLVLAAAAPEAVARQLATPSCGDENCGLVAGLAVEHEAAGIDAPPPEEPAYATVPEKHKDQLLRPRRLPGHARQDTVCLGQSAGSDHPIFSFLEQLTHLPRAP
jgi:hypothetical protein